MSIEQQTVEHITALTELDPYRLGAWVVTGLVMINMGRVLEHRGYIMDKEGKRIAMGLMVDMAHGHLARIARSLTQQSPYSDHSKAMQGMGVAQRGMDDLGRIIVAGNPEFIASLHYQRDPTIKDALDVNLGVGAILEPTLVDSMVSLYTARGVAQLGCEAEGTHLESLVATTFGDSEFELQF
jgi:hypothetical protein